ncbi:MAG: hypothetical protein AAFO58_06185 [Pseudomonadota bacterium]
MSAVAPADTRPLLFAPEDGALRPVFFLHIPKTAGSSNNQFLAQVYGAGQVQTHVENLLPALLAGDRDPLLHPCISGHVPLWAWRLYRGADAYACVTLLRDPWARLVSHINWVARYVGDARLPPGPGGQALARVASWIQETDFEEVGSLRRFMNAVKREPHFSSFDNYQVRMLRTGRMDAMDKRMEAADVDVARSELTQFLHVGFCEDQARFQEGLLTKLGAETALPRRVRTNVAQIRALEMGNTLAREVFAPWIEMDQALVGFALGRFGSG